MVSKLYFLLEENIITEHHQRMDKNQSDLCNFSLTDNYRSKSYRVENEKYAQIITSRLSYRNNAVGFISKNQEEGRLMGC